MQTSFQITPATDPPQTIGANGRIGLVALGSDLTSESDLRRMAPAGVEIFTSRIQNRNPTTPQNLKAMAPDISRTAATILPGTDLDVLIYACTSGTAVIGEAEVIKLLQAGRGELPCTTPIGATIAALGAFDARRISILTPYIESVNREMAAFFESREIEVCNVHGFGIADDTDMAGVAHGAIIDAARQTCRDESDVLFISCTALRAAETAATIEDKIGKLVITSNQAMMWHALKLLQRPFAVAGFGRLFDH